ncbi:MAG: bifunctional folylpolyglutamate synthase/dihydrofolate synthase [Candidatus Promineifilaceae bacterium]|jgi:dihydrofolate synthase/folylpolyglutamate synthase
MGTDEELTIDQAYEEALDFLYSFIDLERRTLDRYQASKMDPSRPRRLLELLGNPQERYPALHIAGTKGKGSVAAMSAYGLQASGLRVGLYTSPHLRDFRERIRVLNADDTDGKIGKADFVKALDRVKGIVPEFPNITWFEIVTAVAFCYFALQEIDVAVIEVGLGGRLDATNVLTPLKSVITSLSYDHTSLLGDTLAEIAFEKGGIIKPGIPVVSAPQEQEALHTLEDIAAERGSRLEVVGREWQYEGGYHQLTVTRSPDEAYVPQGTIFEIALSGTFQLENGMLAVAALEPFYERFPQVTLETIQEGLASVEWDGRLQLVLNEPGLPALLVDSAHNPHSAGKLAAALQEDFQYKRLWLIFGAPMDKAIPPMMETLFPLADQVIVSAADHPRAAQPEALAAQASELGFTVQTAETPGEALLMAFSQAGEEDLICAAGSIIFIGDLLNQWDVLQSRILLPRG